MATADTLPDGFTLDPPNAAPALPAGFILDPPPAPVPALPSGFTLDAPTPAGNARPNPLPLALTDTPENSPAPAPPAAPPAPTTSATSLGIATGPDGQQPPGPGVTIRPDLANGAGLFLPGVRVPGQGLAGAAANALGQGLAGGVAGVVSGAETAAGGALGAAGEGFNLLAQKQRAAMDAIDAGQTVPDADDPVGYGAMTQDQRAAYRAQLAQAPAGGTEPGAPLIAAAQPVIAGAQQLGTNITEGAQRLMPVDTQQEGFATNLARGAGALAPIVAAGLTPAGAALVPGLIGAQSFDTTFRDAKQHGASDDDAFQTGLLNGAVQAGLMSLPVSGALLNATANTGLRDGLLKTVLNLTAHGIGFESAAEAGQFASNYIAQQTYDPQRKLTRGVGDQIGENVALSMLVPGLHGLPTLAAAVTQPRMTASPELRQGAAGLVEASQDLQGSASTSEPETGSAPAPSAPAGGPPAGDPGPEADAAPAGDNPPPQGGAGGAAVALPPGFTLDGPASQPDTAGQPPDALAASLRPAPAPLSGYMEAMRQGESGGRDDARNPGSSASGRYQFLDSTFADFLRSPANTGNWTMADNTTPAAMDAAMGWLTASNADTLRRSLGRDPTQGELAAAHLLGAAGASALIQSPGERLQDVLARLEGPDRAQEIVAKNGALLRGDLTAGQALDNIGRYYLGGNAGVVVPPIAGKPAGAPMPVFTNGGARIDVQPMLVDLSDLITSHDDDGRPNAAFDLGLQPRDRSSAASLSQVQELASNLQPERLAPSSEAATGAPIIDSAGIVESGNGRTMALRRIYTDPNLSAQRDAYVGWLQSQGFDTSGLQQPVLVSQRLTTLDPGALQAFTRDANERSTLGMNAAEQARADASRVGRSLDLWQGSNVGSAANADFVRDVMAQMSPEERGSMMLPDGTLSAAGERRIQGAVTANAYGDTLGPTLERFLNGDDAGTKAVAGALSDAAGPWAQMRSAAARGEIPAELDITPDLATAVDTISRARQLGRPVSELVSQTDLERPPPSPAAQILLSSMFRDPEMRQQAGRDRVASTLKDYAAEAMRQNAGQDMFGAPPPNALAVLEATRRSPDGAPSRARLLSARDRTQSERHAAAAPDARTASPQARVARQRLYDTAQALMRYMGLPPEVGLKLVDRLVDAATGAEADGSYHRQLITFALDTPPDQVPFRLFHEIIHGLMDPELGLLSDAQRRTLIDAADRWLVRDGRGTVIAKTYGVDAASPAGKRVLREEAIARMGEEALARGLVSSGSIGWMYRRMSNFVGGVGAMLRGRGFRTADDVFRELLQGHRALPGSREALLAAGPRDPTSAVLAHIGLPPSMLGLPPAQQPSVQQAPDATGADTTAADAGAVGAPPSAPAATPPSATAPAPLSDFGQKIAALTKNPERYFSLRDAPEGVRFAQKVADLPGFYSAVARTAALLKQERGSGPQFAAAIRNAAGVKPEELKWLGLEDWLRGQTSVTRSQVMDYIAANNLGIREVTKGDQASYSQLDAAEDRLRDAIAADMSLDIHAPAVTQRLQHVIDGHETPRAGGAVEAALGRYHDELEAVAATPATTKYEDYQLPGGDNYREVLLTLPVREADPADIAALRSIPRPEYIPPTDGDLTTYREGPDGRYEQVPFYDDRTPEEAARDAHAHWVAQWEDAQARAPETARERLNYTTPHWPEPNVIAHMRLNDRIEPDGKRVLFVEEVQSDWHQSGRENGYTGDAQATGEAVPDAPFRTSWPALAMKRVLRMAAEEGFDRVAWTSGDTQADRYDLSKVARSLSWNELTGEVLGGYFVISPHATAADLPHILGKDAAAALLAARPDGSRLRRIFPATELRFGGHGMRAFYDRILPNEVSKIVRPYGAQVSRGSIDLTGTGRTDVPPEKASAPVHQVEMTPQLREAALGDGFPLFSLRDRGRTLIASADERRKGFSDALRRALVPITVGAKEAQVASARFANAIADVAWRYGQMDRMIERRFGHAERTLMWNALDEQSLFEITLKESLAQAAPTDRPAIEAQAREAFKGRGMEALNPEQREIVEQLNQLAQQTWKRMQDRGLVDASADGLPYYSPRFFVLTADGKAAVVPGREGGGSITAIDPLGMNLTTRKPLTRELRYTEDSIRAMKALFGPDTELVRDIRTVGVALSKEERAIAGVDLVRSIKDYTAKTGTAVITAQPPAGEAADFVEINHPSLKELVPATRQLDDGTVEVIRDGLGNPVMTRRLMLVHKDFEHPLRAVLTQPQGDLYKAAMRLKSASTGLIMFSPFMHLGVELGRALPALPGTVLSMRWLRDGRTLRADPVFMSEAIRNGLRMVGGSWMQDITGIYDAPNVLPGRSWLARALGSMGDLKDKSFGNDIRQAVDRAGDFWHQTLLWDRVADLQVAIYRDMRAKYLQSFDAKTASIMAAHLANRYAGAMPKEALSNAANKAANLGMFSRSFTLGNLGVMKDMLNGMPSYVRVQIEAHAGANVAQRAKAVLRRKALSAFTLDIGLFYLSNALAQNAMQLLSGQTLDEVAGGYVRRTIAEMQHIAHSWWDLLNPFGVVNQIMPSSENEPSKRDRVWMFDRTDGSAVYARLPMGKVGEEFVGWFLSPAEMVRNKTSTMVRPVWEVISGRDQFGLPIYRPGAETVGELLANAGRAALHIAAAQAPFGSLESVGTIVRRLPGAIAGTNTPLNNKDLADAAMGLVPTMLPPPVNLQMSHGDPRGPAAAVEAEAQREQQYDKAQVLPQARRLLAEGDEDGARALLEGAGLPPQVVNSTIRSAANPARGQVRMQRNFLRGANPGQQSQLEHVTGGSAGLGYAAPDAMDQAAQTGIAQAQQMARSAASR